MVEDIEFELMDDGQTEIRLQHDTGEATVLIFTSPYPMQVQQHYLKSIRKLLETHPDLSPNDDELLGLFTWWFVKCNLEPPLGVGKRKNGERQRIGKRLKEIREGMHMSARLLSMLSGIDPANITRVEQGKHSVGIDVLSKLANTMGYELDFIKIKKEKS